MQAMREDWVDNIVEEAEGFAAANLDDYPALHRWAWECSARRRALFQAIRANSPRPAGAERAATVARDNPEPLPALVDLSEDLQTVLRSVCWPVWDRTGLAAR